MAQALKKDFPDLQIAGNEGGKYRVGAFEVALDGELLWSKLDSGNFPEDAEIVSLVKERARS